MEMNHDGEVVQTMKPRKKMRLHQEVVIQWHMPDQSQQKMKHRVTRNKRRRWRR